MKLALLSVVVVLAFAVASVAFAAPNPSGTGQPNESCQTLQATAPAGIVSTTNGFATKAVNVYAGAPNTPSFLNGNSHAVSQYDVACFQSTSRK
jgi:hypothetical protein